MGGGRRRRAGAARASPGGGCRTLSAAWWRCCRRLLSARLSSSCTRSAAGPPPLSSDACAWPKRVESAAKSRWRAACSRRASGAAWWAPSACGGGAGATAGRRLGVYARRGVRRARCGPRRRPSTRVGAGAGGRSARGRRGGRLRRSQTLASPQVPSPAEQLGAPLADAQLASAASAASANSSAERCGRIFRAAAQTIGAAGCALGRVAAMGRFGPAWLASSSGCGTAKAAEKNVTPQLAAARRGGKALVTSKQALAAPPSPLRFQIVITTRRAGLPSHATTPRAPPRPTAHLPPHAPAILAPTHHPPRSTRAPVQRLARGAQRLGRRRQRRPLGCRPGTLPGAASGAQPAHYGRADAQIAALAAALGRAGQGRAGSNFST